MRLRESNRAHREQRIVKIRIDESKKSKAGPTGKERAQTRKLGEPVMIGKNPGRQEMRNLDPRRPSEGRTTEMSMTQTRNQMLKTIRDFAIGRLQFGRRRRRSSCTM